MVLEHYNLTEQPFGVTPDPRYLFLSPTHREALASAVYGVTAGRGFTALIAKPGMGKTTLLFDLLNKVKAQARTAFLFQSQTSPRDMLRSLLDDLGLEHTGSDVAKMQRKLNECLLEEASKGKQLVVVIDEAQNLDEPVFEVVRMLSNFETPREKLMHFILAGQPQLAEKLDSPGLLQLRQRISIIARLKPFSADETQLYIDHRLRVAGYDFKRPLFTNKALAMIAEHSEGIPRNINNVCFNAISLGSVNKQKTIDEDVIREVLGDLDLRSIFSEPTIVSKSEKSKDSVPTLSSSDASQLPPKSWSVRPIAAAPAVISKYDQPNNPRRAPLPKNASRSQLRRWSMRLGLAAALAIVAEVGMLIRTGKPTTDVLASATPPTVTALDSVARPAISPVARNEGHLAVSAPITTNSQSTGPKVIVVRPNDDLYRICLENFGRYDEETFAKLQELNPWLTKPRLIRVGQKIRVPGPRNNSRKTLPLAEPAPAAIDAGMEK